VVEFCAFALLCQPCPGDNIDRTCGASGLGVRRRPYLPVVRLACVRNPCPGDNRDRVAATAVARWVGERGGSRTGSVLRVGDAIWDCDYIVPRAGVADTCQTHQCLGLGV
jgi:hypothetical protein